MSQLEIYYKISDDIYLVLLVLVTAYCLAYFVRPFMENNKYVWTVSMFYSAVMIVLHYIPYPLENFMAYGMGVLAAFIVMCLLDRRNFRQKIFLAVTFFTLRWQTMCMEGCIDQMIFHWFYYDLPGASLSPECQFGFFILSLVIDLILSFCFMYAVVYMLRKAYLYKKDLLNTKELFMLIMPSLTGALGYKIYRYYVMVYERDSGKSFFDLYGSNNALDFLYYSLSLFTIYAMITVFQSSKVKQEEEKQKELLARQVSDIENHIKEVERLYRDIRSLRHDMGNHVMLLEQLYGKGEYEAAGKYLSELKGQMQETSSEIRSGNPITDVILAEKKKEAEEKGVSFICDFCYPESKEINAFDISVILGNALTNAMEAVMCEIEKRDLVQIHISSYRKSNAYIIEVRNSFTGKLTLDAASGLPVTTKPAGTGHGFGLVNIRRVAQKYYGDLDISQDGENCILRVMLQI